MNMEKKPLQRRKIPVLSVTSNTYYKKSHLISHKEFNKLIYNELIPAISDGLKKNKKAVTLFKINDSDYSVQLSKDDWENSLNKAISYFEQREEYEKCTKCLELIKQI